MCRLSCTLISRPLLALGLPLTLLWSSHADEISLGAEGKVSGKILRFHSAQQLLLESPIASQPLEILAEKLQSLSLSPTATPPENTSPQWLELSNGDQLPISIQQLDTTTLDFLTPWNTLLKVPRRKIRAIHFDAADAKVFYQGPTNDWELSKAWKIENNALTSLAWGPAHRSFDSIPDRYVIDFDVAWTSGNAGFKFVFASDHVDGNAPSDAYFLQFNSAGLELKRQTQQQHRQYISLASFNDLTPDHFEQSRMSLTLRVDRSNRLLQLAIDGKNLRRTIIDPKETGPIPTGKVFSFQSTSGPEDQIRIQNIRISSWPSATAEARQEKRPDSPLDVLFDIDSNRISGTLHTIQPGKELTVVFESPHDPKPQPIPAHKIAVIHLSNEATQAPKQGYRMELLHRGMLHASDFTLEKDLLQLQHPLLGKLSIPRSHIRKIEKLAP